MLFSALSGLVSPVFARKAETSAIEPMPLQAFRLFLPLPLADTSFIVVELFKIPNRRPTVPIEVGLILWM